MCVYSRRLCLRVFTDFMEINAGLTAGGVELGVGGVGLFESNLP